jgi:hypothetical protein
MKNKHRHHNHQSTPSTTGYSESSSRPTTEQISKKAYEIYLQQGSPEGRSIDHWLEAEASLGVQTNVMA